MINLIPNEEKKEMKKAFYFRLAVLFLGAGSASLLLASAAILPAYFLASAKDTLTQNRLEEQKNEPMPELEAETAAAIKDLDGKLRLIESAEEDKFAVSSNVINAIVLKKTPEIKITGISYEKNPGNNSAEMKKIKIGGSAPSRQALLLFRQALEASGNWKQVDLPISNFVRGSNIQFYISLAL